MADDTEEDVNPPAAVAPPPAPAMDPADMVPGSTDDDYVDAETPEAETWATAPPRPPNLGHTPASFDGNADKIANYEARLANYNNRQAATARSKEIVKARRQRNAEARQVSEETGAQFRTDEAGDYQPLIDPDTGRQKYTPRTSPVRYDEQGKPYQVKNDETGARTIEDPDKEAEYGENPDDPTDPLIYRKTKATPWQPIDPEEALKSPDKKLVASAARILHKRELNTMESQRADLGLQLQDPVRPRALTEKQREELTLTREALTPPIPRPEPKTSLFGFTNQQATATAEADWMQQEKDRRGQLGQIDTQIAGDDERTALEKQSYDLALQHKTAKDAGPAGYLARRRKESAASLANLPADQAAAEVEARSANLAGQDQEIATRSTALQQRAASLQAEMDKGVTTSRSAEIDAERANIQREAADLDTTVAARNALAEDTNAGLTARQEKEKAERKVEINKLRDKPETAPFADQLDTLEADLEKRATEAQKITDPAARQAAMDALQKEAVARGTAIDSELAIAQRGGFPKSLNPKEWDAADKKAWTALPKEKQTAFLEEKSSADARTEVKDLHDAVANKTFEEWRADSAEWIAANKPGATDSQLRAEHDKQKATSLRAIRETYRQQSPEHERAALEIFYGNDGTPEGAVRQAEAQYKESPSDYWIGQAKRAGQAYHDFNKAALGLAAHVTGNKEFAAALLIDSQASQEDMARDYPQLVDGVQNVQSPQDAAVWAAQGIITLAPDIAESVSASVVGAVVGGATTGGLGAIPGFFAGLLGKAAVKSLAKKELKKLGVKTLTKAAIEAEAKNILAKPAAKSLIAAEIKSIGAKAGVMLGSVASSYKGNTAEIYTSLLNDPDIDPDTAAATALIFGIPAAAVDIIPEVGPLKKILGLGDKAVGEFASNALRYRSRLLKEAGDFGLAVVGEGAGEGSQAFIGFAAQRFAKHGMDFSKYEPLTKDEWDEFVESTAMGTLGGTVFGAGGAVSGVQDARKEFRDATAAEAPAGPAIRPEQIAAVNVQIDAWQPPAGLTPEAAQTERLAASGAIKLISGRPMESLLSEERTALESKLPDKSPRMEDVNGTPVITKGQLSRLAQVAPEAANLAIRDESSLREQLLTEDEDTEASQQQGPAAGAPGADPAASGAVTAKNPGLNVPRGTATSSDTQPSAVSSPNDQTAGLPPLPVGKFGALITPKEKAASRQLQARLVAAAVDADTAKDFASYFVRREGTATWNTGKIDAAMAEFDQAGGYQNPLAIRKAVFSSQKSQQAAVQEIHAKVVADLGPAYQALTAKERKDLDHIVLHRIAPELITYAGAVQQIVAGMKEAGGAGVGISKGMTFNFNVTDMLKATETRHLKDATGAERVVSEEVSHLANIVALAKIRTDRTGQTGGDAYEVAIEEASDIYGQVPQEVRDHVRGIYGEATDGVLGMEFFRMLLQRDIAVEDGKFVTADGVVLTEQTMDPDLVESLRTLFRKLLAAFGELRSTLAKALAAEGRPQAEIDILLNRIDVARKESVDIFRNFQKQADSNRRAAYEATYAGQPSTDPAGRPVDNAGGKTPAGNGRGRRADGGSGSGSSSVGGGTPSGTGAGVSPGSTATAVDPAVAARLAQLEGEKADREAAEERAQERRNLAVTRRAEAGGSKESILKAVPEDAKALASAVLEKVQIGDPSYVLGANRERLPASYIAAAPETVQASHAGEDFHKNPLYGGENTRPYHSDETEQNKVRSIALPGALDEDAVVTDAKSAADGPAQVVLAIFHDTTGALRVSLQTAGGNGREQGINLAPLEDQERLSAAWTARGEAFGLSSMPEGWRGYRFLGVYDLRDEARNREYLQLVDKLNPNQGVVQDTAARADIDAALNIPVDRLLGISLSLSPDKARDVMIGLVRDAEKLGLDRNLVAGLVKNPAQSQFYIQRLLIAAAFRSKALGDFVTSAQWSAGHATIASLVRSATETALQLRDKGHGNIADAIGRTLERVTEYARGGRKLDLAISQAAEQQEIGEDGPLIQQIADAIARKVEFSPVNKKGIRAVDADETQSGFDDLMRDLSRGVELFTGEAEMFGPAPTIGETLAAAIAAHFRKAATVPAGFSAAPVQATPKTPDKENLPVGSVVTSDTYRNEREIEIKGPLEKVWPEGRPKSAAPDIRYPAFFSGTGRYGNIYVHQITKIVSTPGTPEVLNARRNTFNRPRRIRDLQRKRQGEGLNRWESEELTQLEKSSGQEFMGFFEEAREDNFQLEGQSAIPEITRALANQGSFDFANGQLQARGYHGTPHKIDPREGFLLKKIGTGEGAQTYGWGLYFAGNPAVAKVYQRQIAQRAGVTDAWFLEPTSADARKKYRDAINFADAAPMLISQMIAQMPDQSVEAIVGKIRESATGYVVNGVPVRPRPAYVDAYNAIAALIESGKLKVTIPKGNIYTVELDVEPEDLLDWDKPLSDQSDAVQKALRSTDWFQYAEDQLDGLDNPDGSSLYRWLTEDYTPKEASEKLKEAGIPGIRYLDQGSRTEGKGTYNYVIFDESKIRIIAENGQEVGLDQVAPAPADQLQLLARRASDSPSKQAAQKIIEKQADSAATGAYKEGDERTESPESPGPSQRGAEGTEGAEDRQPGGLPADGSGSRSQSESRGPRDPDRPLLGYQRNLDAQGRDPRLVEAFPRSEWNALGVPVIPKSDLSEDHPLLQETAGKTEAVLTKDSLAVRLLGLKPGKISRAALREAIVGYFMAGGNDRKPLSAVVKPTAAENKEALFMGGGGGSGKSSMLKKMVAARDFVSDGKVLVNPDEIRDFIPEYEVLTAMGDGRGSARSHQEAADIIAAEVYRRARQQGLSLIIDGTMKSAAKGVKKMRDLRVEGYFVRMLAVTIDPHEAMVRGYLRGKSSGRFVPDDVLLGAHQGFNAALPAYIRFLGNENVTIFDNSPEAPIQLDGTLDVLSGKFDGVKRRGAMNPDATTVQELLASYGEEMPGDSSPLQLLARANTAQDADYLAAVERGDMETAQRMAEKYAASRGYDSVAPVAHGTASQEEQGGYDANNPNDHSYYKYEGTQAGDWTIPKMGWSGVLYVTANKRIAGELGARQVRGTPRKKVRVINLFLKSGNYFDATNPVHLAKLRSAISPQEITDSREWWEKIPDGAVVDMRKAIPRWYHLADGANGWQLLESPQVIERLKKLGFDGYKATENTPDDGELFTSTAVFSPSQIKSADAVTRDAAGKVIPLSQRFNPANPSILQARRNISFASGIDKEADARGAIAAGVAIGSTAQILAKNRGVFNLFAGALKSGTPVFVDSGAFGASRTGKSVDFNAIFSTYLSLVGSAKTRGQLTIVGPDILGDQDSSAQLVRDHANHIREALAKGARVILPVQHGKLSIREYLQRVGFSPNEVAIGIPANKFGYPRHLLRDEISDARVKDVHFLGMSNMNASAGKLVAAATESGATSVTLDANRIRSKAGRTITTTDPTSEEFLAQLSDSQHDNYTEIFDLSEADRESLAKGALGENYDKTAPWEDTLLQIDAYRPGFIERWMTETMGLDRLTASNFRAAAVERALSSDGTPANDQQMQLLARKNAPSDEPDLFANAQPEVAAYETALETEGITALPAKAAAAMQDLGVSAPVAMDLFANPLTAGPAKRKTKKGPSNETRSENPGEDLFSPGPSRPPAAGPKTENGEESGSDVQPERDGPADPLGEREQLKRPRRPEDPADRNHIITEGETVAPRTDGEKWDANVAAIELYRTLQAENRNPSPEEKKVLARYTGWGWAKEAFNQDNERYQKRYAKLRALLGEEEFMAARKSSLNAHYTALPIIRSMWDIARRLGFTGGRVLEPAGGVGHFFGMMPPEMAENSRLFGVELDQVSGGIFKLLYPEAEVQVAGFQEAGIPNNSIDLAISNVPFGNYKVAGGMDYPNLLIHDYFFARSLDKVRPGGLVMFITSDGTMDKSSKQVRELLAEKADLVGAIRLPNDAFAENAGTEVTTDILILRKKDGTDFPGHKWTMRKEVGQDTVRVRQPDGSSIEEVRDIWVNQYFADHPEMVLGRHSLKGTMYADGDYALVSRPGQDTPALMRKAIDSLPDKNLFEGQESYQDTQAEDGGLAGGGTKEGSYVQNAEGFFQVVDKRLVPAPWLKLKNYGKDFGAEIPAENVENRQLIASDWMEVRESALDVINAEVNPAIEDTRLWALRDRLNRVYDGYVKKWGTLTKRNRHNEKAAFLEDDPEYSLLQALETERKEFDKDGKARLSWEKADIFTKRIRQPRARPERVDNINDAINTALSFDGLISPKTIGELLGIPPQEAEAQIVASGRAFRNPRSGLIEPAEKYLSGNVLRKLGEAIEAAKNDPALAVNVAALEIAKPPDVSLGEIYFELASRWIPSQVTSLYATNIFGTPTTVKYSQALNKFTVTLANENTPENQTTHATDDFFGRDLLIHALNGTEPAVTKAVKGTDKREPDQAATQEAKRKMRIIEKQFQSWAKTTTDTVEGGISAQEAMEKQYNAQNNAIVPPAYSGDYLVDDPANKKNPAHSIPGLSDVVWMNGHRRAVVARILQEGCCMMAHGVGSGKTFSQIVAAMEMKRLGLARKPMIVVQKATIGQFAKSVREAYPSARILVANEKTFAKQNRRRFMSQIATGDYDMVIVTQPQFDRILPGKELIREYFGERLATLEQMRREEAAAQGDKKRGRKGGTSDIEKAIERLRTKMEKLLNGLKTRADDVLDFEQLGVDALFIDEAHAYKKTSIITNMKRVRGVPNDESQRAMGLEMKAQFIQSINNGRNVILATGTPITNTMAEAYVMLKLATPHVLKEYNIENFDDWARTFGIKKTDVEYSWGGKWKMATRFNKFVNGPELVAMIRSGFDVKMGNKELGLNVPVQRGEDGADAPIYRVLPATEAMEKMADWILRIAAEYEDVMKHGSSEDKKAAQAIPIVTMQAGMAAALDPRLVDPTAPDDPASKVNQAMRDAHRIWLETADNKGAMVIFADRFKPMNVSLLEGFVGGQASDISFDETEDQTEDTGDEDKEEGESELSKQEDKEFASSGFNLYHDMREKLVALGVPREQIGIIHEHNTDIRRAALFDAVNAGRIRIVIGSTEKLGVGVNMQERLAAMLHLDPPRMMTPAMMEQRIGRGVRQGNGYAPNDGPKSRNWGGGIYNLMYAVEKSMDTGIYQMLENKGRFISQVLSGVGVGRSFEDAADELTRNMAMMKAIATGDTRVMRMAELKQQFDELDGELAGFENGKSATAKKLAGYNREVDTFRNSMAPRLAKDLTFFSANFVKGGPMPAVVIGGETFTEHKDAVAAIGKMPVRLISAAMRSKDNMAVEEATIGGVPVRFNLSLTLDAKEISSQSLRIMSPTDPSVEYTTKGWTSDEGPIQTVRNFATGFQSAVDEATANVEGWEKNIVAMKAEMAAKWERQEEFNAVAKELRGLERELLSQAEPERQAPEDTQLQARRNVDDPNQENFDFDAIPEDRPAAAKDGALDPLDRFKGELPQALAIASGYSNIPGVDQDEIRQSARLALADAAREFDPARGKPFAAYAGVAVRNRLRSLYRKEAFRRERFPVSLDETIGENNTETRGDFTADTATPSAADRAALGEGRRLLESSISELPDRMQQIVRAFYANEQDTETADRLGISKQAVGNLKRVAFERLRGKLGERGVSSTEQLLARRNGPVSDVEYLAAVERGEEAKAQDMVDVAARAAGIPWSGVVSRLDGKIEATYAREAAAAADFHHGLLVPPAVQERIREGEAEYFWIDNDGQVQSITALPASIRKGIKDQLAGKIASHAPVKRDSAGNVIPLSERFNTESPSILKARPNNSESDEGSEGEQESPEGDEIDALLRDLDAEIPAYQAAALAEEAARGSRTIGRPDLAHGADNADVRGADAYYTDNFSVQTETQWQSEADAMLARDYAGTKRAIENAGLSGQAISPAQTKAAEQIATDLRNAMLTAGTPESRAAFNVFWIAFRGTGTAAGRALAARRDPLKTPAERYRDFLIDLMLKPRPEAQKEIDAAKTPAEKTALIDAETAALLAKLKAAGISVEDILKDRVTLSLQNRNILDEFIQLLARATGDKESRQRAFRMLLKNRGFADIAKATGLAESAVRQLKADFIAKMRQQHFAKFQAGAKADSASLITGKKVDDVTAEKEFTKWLGVLGIVSEAKQGRPKFDIEDPAHVMRLARAIQSATRTGLSDMLYEWWIMNILSGPQTQFVNIAGNSVNAAWDMTVQRGMEATVNLALRDNKAARFGEFQWLFKGLLPGMARGLTMAARAWSAEYDFFEHTVLGTPLEIDSFDKAGNVRAAIPGKLGRVVRIPGRALLFADSFFKTAIGQAEVAAVAYRMARAEGLSAKKLTDRIALLSQTRDQVIASNLAKARPSDEMVEYFAKALARKDSTLTADDLIADRTSPAWEMAREQTAFDMARTAGWTDAAWQRAVDKAKEMTFQQDLRTAEEGGNPVEDLAAKMQEMRGSNKLLALFFPFVRTPYNIFRMGIRKSPLGSVSLAYHAAQGLYGLKNGTPYLTTHPEAVREVAEQLIAWTALALLWGAAQGDDDDEDKAVLITGSMPFNMVARGQRELQQRAYGGDYVIRIGGRNGITFHYGRYEPFATVLGTTIDTIRAIKSKGATADNMDALYGYLMAQANSKTFLQGFSDISKALEGSANVGEGTRRFVLQAIVPNILRQPLRNLDDYVRDTKHADAAYQALPAATLAQPKTSIYGGDVKKGGNPVMRLFFTSPLAADAQLAQADTLLLNWNRNNPAEAYAPQQPGDTYKRGGKEHKMTAEEYRRFSVAAGRLAVVNLRARLNAAKVARPTKDDVETVRKAFEDARTSARERMFR